MRASRFFLSTLKEAPADAEIVSHRLMLRAGMVKRLAGGIYSWMPLGLRVVRKIEEIVRSEMNRSGAIEVSMPIVQPAELWEESGRWKVYGPELLRFRDRHERDFVMQPTSEEVITDIVRSDLKSYRQLPLHLYQIQTKFRDERRPRFGVMRGREFLMKDGYSFHADYADLEREYQNMYETYTRIFTQLGLKFRAVAADPGSIGGTGSHEFHVLADSGEDTIAYSNQSGYAANVELAEASAKDAKRQPPGPPMTEVPTPGLKTCQKVAELLGIGLNRTVKAIALTRDGEEHGAKMLNLLLLRGDHTLNEIKAAKIPDLAPFKFASDAEILNFLHCEPGYIGPVGENKSVRIIADRTVAEMSDFVCGANRENFHLSNVNWGRDLPEPDLIADIRNVVSGDPSPDGYGSLELCRGIEVGHIFQLRTKYSEPLKCGFLDDGGKHRLVEMGCYGIGITRIVGAAIEQNHDERGIILPDAIAPFRVVIIPIGLKKSEVVRELAEKTYSELTSLGIETFLDDRDERPGVMFADSELIGIPHRVVIGERGLKDGQVEYQGRRDLSAQKIASSDLIQFLKERLARGET